MTKRLTTKLMMDATLAWCRIEETLGVHEQVAELHVKVKLFEALVWFPRLRAMVNGTKCRGMSGAFRGINVRTWCCAGRCLIQFDRANASITLITADDEKPWFREMATVAPDMGPMGIQGIDAEHIHALVMLYEAVRYGGEIVLNDDEDVTIG